MVPDVYTEARVINPPARVLARTDDGVWSGDLFYWLRDPAGAWWGHVESISHTPPRRGIIAATHLQPLAPEQVHVWLDAKWQPGQVLGWRTTVDDRGTHGWEALVEVKTRKWGARIVTERLWFRLPKLRGADPPPPPAASHVVAGDQVG